MLITDSLIKDAARRFKAQGVARHAKQKDGPRGKVITPAKRKAMYCELLASTSNAQAAANALERIIAGNDLVGVNYLAIGLRAARSVGRISLLNSSGRLIGYATGFLAAPGALVTNNHVFGTDLDAQNAFIEFDYEYDANGQDRQPVRFALNAGAGLFITDKELDFSAVGVAPRSQDGSRALSDYGYLPLSPRPGKSFEGEYLTIIQHPGGERKQVCVRENKLIKYLDTTLWYETDTVAGSSGSPVFNGFWDVVALHHSGVPAKDAHGRTLAIDGRVWDETMGEDKVKWIANEGIRISSLVDFLRSKHAGDAVARLILDAGVAGAPKSAGPADGSMPREAMLRTENGQVTLTVPVPISLRLGTDGLIAPAPAGAVAPPRPAGAAPSVVQADAFGIEKVVVDQKNYDERPGYDENFLGKGALKVPLPTLPAKAKAQAVTAKGSKTPLVLKYYNYSLVMNAKRKLAFHSTVNIDGATRRATGKRDGDRWYVDPRIPAEVQVDDKFYAAVKIKDSKRAVFDRGHLVRRLDATWGPTEALAKRNGDDTFHFTNCSPQHYEFNEGHMLWAGIEDFVLFHAENAKQKATVINGPVFGADDEKAQGVLIPKAFFKIAVFAKDGALACAGFLLSQADLVKRDLPEEALRPLSADQAHAFQVKISKIAQMTGLGFGPLSRHDGALSAFEEATVVQPLAALSDIRI